MIERESKFFRPVSEIEWNVDRIQTGRREVHLQVLGSVDIDDRHSVSSLDAQFGQCVGEPVRARCEAFKRCRLTVEGDRWAFGYDCGCDG